MDIKRWIARRLGYGGIEWPRAAILDMPIRIVELFDLANVTHITTDKYPGGVQVLPGEIGCNGVHRLILEVETPVIPR